MNRLLTLSSVVLLTPILGVWACSSADPPEDPARIRLNSEDLPEYQPHALPGGTLDPLAVPKYVTPLVVPPAMPRTGKLVNRGAKNVEYYEIAVRQFAQDILPASMSMPTTVWSYGSTKFPGTAAQGGSFHYPAFTIEAKWNSPVRVRWINELVVDPVDCFYTPGGPSNPASCNYLPHLLPVDETLHWANPRGECQEGVSRTDCRGTRQAPYLGPVPIVTHVHGAHTSEESDGYPEAWYLPNANDIAASDFPFREGGFYSTFKTMFEMKWGTGAAAEWQPGSSVYQYPNDMAATTLWYHDHSLGMTRTNVYAGPAGFYLLRGGPGDDVRTLQGSHATLPGPAPALGDPPGLDYYEIPIVVQDRSFNDDGSLFYPDNREFFEGLEDGDLDSLGVNFAPINGSEVAPMWNPEFFGNTIVVNGKTWPYLDVEPRQYRLRLLNGCQSRFLYVQLVKASAPDDPATWTAVPGLITQIGAEGGFLPAPLPIDQLLIAPAERADVIVDFSQVTLAGDEGLYLVNIGPDEPFGGGVPGADFSSAHPGTTGQIMKFNLVALKGSDSTTPASELVLPALAPLPAAVDTVRKLTLNEDESATETVCIDEEENPVPITNRPAGSCPDGVTYSVCTDGATYMVEAGDTCGNALYPTKVEVDTVPFGPTSARLGVLDAEGMSMPMMWNDHISETPGLATTETWEFYNFTMDAHPIHIHLVQFEVINRQLLQMDEEEMAAHPAVLLPDVRGPEPWETGRKDTVIAYPGEVTRVKAVFDTSGLFVWHCHILEHEDNEMMRPFCVKNGDSTLPQTCQKANMGSGHHGGM